ncbi:MAG TPA: TIR domain-containing protein [Anaerolineales bacterium]|nr:TIR domain-containing protein [Anaerolineales bacterium]
MAKLFVSYSRRDSVAARRLIDSFKSIEQDVWVDWESIPPAVDWLEQIFRGIEEADAFIFLISPDSLASEVCKVEINRAAQNNKRIIPIVLRDVDHKTAPESIGKLNWTFIRETDNFEEGLAKVKTAIELDLDWLEEHRRLQVRSLEWHRKKDPSLLLRGRDLRNAYRMLQTATSKDPTPTDLQNTYILHSIKSDRNRRFAILATGIAVIALALLYFLATEARDDAITAQTAEAQQRQTAVAALTEEAKQRQIAVAALTEEAKQRQIAVTAQAVAVHNEIVAEAQRSAARAQIYEGIPGELYTSTLLAIDSMDRQETTEAEEILRRNLSLLPRPLAQFAQMGKINALAFNPDGDVFVTASADGTACAWSIEVEEEKVSNSFCTSSKGAALNAVAFSRDGSFLVTGDQAGIVQIFDSQNGDLLREFQRVEPPSSQVQIAEVDGETPRNIPVRSISTRPTRAQQIAVAFDDGWIPVFDPNTGDISSPLWIGNRPNVAGVSPNGVWLVAGSANGRVSVWNLGTGNRFPTSTHRGGVLAMAFSPTENKVATAGSDTIAIANLSIESENKELYRIPIQSPIRDIAFSPDGTWFVTGSDDRRIRVWETLSGNELRAMTQDGAVTEVTVSSDGKWIASTGNDRTARVWDAATGAEIFQIPLKISGSQLAFANNDQWLVTTDASGAVAIWDISKIVLPELTVSSTGTVNHVQYSPSGEWLAVASEDKVYLLTPDQQSILRQPAFGSPVLDLDSSVAKLVFSHDSTLLGTLTEENEVDIYDLAARRRQTVPVTESIQSIAFTPDNQQLVTSDSNGNLQAWDVLSPESPLDVDGVLQGTSLTSAGEVLAVGSPDQIIILSDEGNGDFPTIEFSGDKAFLVLSPDGSLLASSSASGDVTVFQYQDHELIKLTSFRKEPAASLAFHPDGTLLAVGTARNVYLMDVSSGKEVARIPHISTVNGVSFSEAGRYLATGSSQALRFWEMADIPLVRTEDLIETACLSLPENFDVSQLSALFEEEDYDPVCDDREAP